MQRSQTGWGKCLQNQQQTMMLLISVICSPLGLWLPLSWTASASWKWSREMLEMGAFRASALTGEWWESNSHPEVSAEYTYANLTFHQDAFAVRRHAWGSWEPRNLVIPNRWYQTTVLCWTFCKRRDSHVNSGTSTLEGPIHLIPKSQAFQQRWGSKKPGYETILSVCIVIEIVLQEAEDWQVLPPHQDFLGTAWEDGFLVMTQVTNHRTLDVFTYGFSIPALGDVASDKLFFLMHSVANGWRCLG